MAKNLEVLFDYKPENEAEYIETVSEYGAVVLKGYWQTVQAEGLTREVMAGRFTAINRVHPKSGVHEQYGLQQWTDVAIAPSRAQELAEQVEAMVQAQGIPWSPNTIRAQLYGEGKAGMKYHRDPKSAATLVAIMNASGTAPFGVKAGRYDVSTVVRAGDLIILNNTVLPGIDNRTKHRVGPPLPKTISRLSVTLREEVSEVA